MKPEKIPFYPYLWMLFLLASLLWGFQNQTQKLPTRAESGPGSVVLANAKQSKSEQRFQEGFAQALEAAQIFQKDAYWDSWAECYELAFQCAYKSDDKLLYKQLLEALHAAAATLQTAREMPVNAQMVVYRRLGSVQHNFGAYDQAGENYEKALPFAEQLADTALVLRLYGNLGIVLWNQGDDYRALSYLEKALGLARVKRDTNVMVSVLKNLGNATRTLDPHKSISVYLEALQFNPEDAEAHVLLSKGYLEGLKDYKKALASADKSLALANKEPEKADALHQLGRISFERKDYNKALGFYDKAYDFALIGYGKNHPECAKITLFKGKVYAAMKAFPKALESYNQTLADLLPLFSPQNRDQHPAESEFTTFGWWVMEALLEKSKTYDLSFQESQHTEDLDRSLDCAELALKYQNKLKLRYGDDASKFELAGHFVPTCERALQSAFKLLQSTGSISYAKRAFQISEQTKAVVLAEALYKKDIKQLSGIPMELLDREKRLFEANSFFEKKLDTEDAAARALVKDSLFQVQRQLELLEQEIQKNYPAYGMALFSYKSEVNLDSVRQHLPADAAMLEYFLGDSAIYTFLISKDTFWVKKQALPTAFNAVCNQFLHSLNDWAYVTDSSAHASHTFLESSHLLYQWLLEKPLKLVQGHRLFVIPDGKLSMLPFELFLSQPHTGSWIDRDIPYVLKDYAVSYRFSARSQIKHSDENQDGWGGFGLQEGEGQLSESEKGPGNFDALPHVGEEITAIKKVLGGPVWLNKAATRDNFLDNAARFGILHLATHGQIDPQNPLKSKLLFSRSAAGQDPFVYASDLYKLQLRAGLSVLSACQSGTGAWKKGEGVMSLARAFAFAGCPSMVMSQWNVSDQSTADLMVSFYKNLKAGDTKDEALRKAKLNYLETGASAYAKPIYWGAFVPIGEMESLPEIYFTQSKNWSNLALWASLFLLLIGLLIFLYRRYGKKSTRVTSLF